MAIASITLFAAFFLLLLVRVPLAIALGLSSFLYFFFFTTIPLTQVTDRLFTALNSFPLMAIPFFILAANIMSQGGISQRLITAASSVVGQFRGGLAITAVLSCMFFAAISGSNTATVVAVGTLLIPGMVRNGYDRDFSTGLVATSGSLGILIPPSIPLILYGILTQQSIGDLFLAGIFPGLMSGILLIGLVIIISRWKNFGSSEEQIPTSVRERVVAFRDAFFGLLLPIIVLGGIYTGAFTPTEAAVVAVFYALIVSIFIYREVNLKDLARIAVDSARMSAMIMFIVANALLFAFVLAAERIPDVVAGYLLSLDLSTWVFLLFVNVLYLAAGTFLDGVGALVLLVPIIFPVAMELGVDPIHLGIIIVMNLEIGAVTPPLGLNLVVGSGISGLPLLQVAKAAIPTALVLLIALLLVTFIPAIAISIL